MIEIRNKEKGMIQIPCRSFAKTREHTKELTVLNIPGRTTRLCPDERFDEVYLQRAKKWGQIDYRYIPQNEIVHEEEK